MTSRSLSFTANDSKYVQFNPQVFIEREMHSRSLSKVKSLPSRGTSSQARSNIRRGGGYRGCVEQLQGLEVDLITFSKACAYDADNIITMRSIYRVFLSCLKLNLFVDYNVKMVILREKAVAMSSAKLKKDDYKLNGWMKRHI